MPHKLTNQMLVDLYGNSTNPSYLRDVHYDIVITRGPQSF